MPIPVTMNVEAAQLRPGDTIRWVGNPDDAQTAWAGLTVKRVQEPRLKAHRGTHFELVLDGDHKNPLLPVDQSVGVVRQIPTYGEKVRGATDLLRYVIREHIAKAQRWTPAMAVEPLTQSPKGVPFVHPLELVNAAAWHIEGMVIHAQYAGWWLRVARVAAREADGGPVDDHLIDAARWCVTDALREVQSMPGGSSSEGHRFTEMAARKGTARFLEDLTNFGHRAGGLLDTYQRAVELEAQYGSDMPAVLS